MSKLIKDTTFGDFSGTYLRFSEYYNQTELHDKLYSQSKKGQSFNKIMNLILTEENIMLAFRTIKSNNGSTTPGVDGKTIVDIKEREITSYVKLIRHSILNYKPYPIRRVYIPKSNGKMRPLGIPTIKDRLIQQSIKQILEPILEAKFYKHSYGFRPLRSNKDALSELYRRLSIGKNSFVVDIDIKGFFDNIDHKLIIKLLKKQGIKDSRLLKVIKLILASKVEGETFTGRGVPQGGIISPLISNLVLNELDWFVANQWESFKTRRDYSSERVRFAAQSKTSLKSGYIVRYADDFKITCKTRDEAERWYKVVVKFLKDKLNLDVSPEKSGITNCKQTATDFLGVSFLIKEDISNNRSYNVRTKMTKKSKKMAVTTLRTALRRLKRYPEEIGLVNSKIAGIHNYFKVASEVNIDMGDIYNDLSRLYKSLCKNYKSTTFNNFCKENPTSSLFNGYSNYNYKVPLIGGVPLIHVKQVKFSRHNYFSQEKNIYTLNGREKLKYKGWSPSIFENLRRLTEHAMRETTQFLDNKLSRYAMANGKCEVTGVTIMNAEDIHCHHLIPRAMDGEDTFANLRILHSLVHRLIHASKTNTVNDLLSEINTLSPVDKETYKKINNYRRIAGNEEIKVK